MEQSRCPRFGRERQRPRLDVRAVSMDTTGLFR